MATYDWYIKLRQVLPHDFLTFMDDEFPDWEKQIAEDEYVFEYRIRDFIDEHIGKSAGDFLSVKVYAILDGKSEGAVAEEFARRGYK